MFTYNGIHISNFGVCNTMPPFKRAKKRVNYYQIPGSRKSYAEEDGFEPYVLNFKVTLLDKSDLDEFIEWLSGEGEFIRDDDPLKSIHVRMDSEIAYERFSRGIELPVAEVEMIVLEPFRKLVTEPNVTITNGATYANIGTIESEPIITISGSGEVVININGRSFTYNFDSPSVTIDSQEMNCKFGTTLKNRRMIGEFPYLDIGNNVISWTGDITTFTLTPNTRWL